MEERQYGVCARKGRKGTHDETAIGNRVNRTTKFGKTLSDVGEEVLRAKKHDQNATKRGKNGEQNVPSGC
jgi:phospholipase/lecithinase/hemolysin